MLDTFPIALLVGTVLGFLSGLGIGGGSLLILWLTMAVGMEYPAARGINLLFFLPAAIVAIIFRNKSVKIPWKSVIPAALGGCLTATVCYYLSHQLDLAILKKCFGILLIITGIREIMFKDKNNRGD